MISSRLMIAFEGTHLPASVARDIRDRQIAGVTLFRAANVDSAEQVRALAAELQAVPTAADAGDGDRPAGRQPLLVATDQEGGQLNAFEGFTTPFAGAMALGATGSEELAERVAGAMARELRALGVNVSYAPVCDLATNPQNPVLGIRSFGDDPQVVGRLAAATVRGLQAGGVAATAKHFPGHGDISVDTHHQLGIVDLTREAFESRELVPFRAAFEAGARMVMAGHFATPSITGDRALPASLAHELMTKLLRDDLGFDGVAITDALDMAAIAQGPAAQIVDAIAAVRAGEDLLLGTPDAALTERLEQGLDQADLRGLIDHDVHRRSLARVRSLRKWLGSFDQPPLDVICSPEHRALAAELADRSVALVRNDDRLIPLRPHADARVAVVQPQPTNLTPADTSAECDPLLADAVRKRHPGTEEFVVASSPTDSEISDLIDRLSRFDTIVLGTVAASLIPPQAAMAKAVLDLGKPTLWIALRTPWDLEVSPSARTYACSFGILEPSIEAVVAAVFGEQGFAGKLPVELPNLYPRGHGLVA